MRKFIKILFIILVIVGIYFAYVYSHKDDDIKQKELEEIEEYNDILRDLRIEKEALNKDLEALKSEFVVENMGSTVIVISDTDKQTIDSIVSLMNEYGYKGVIVVYEDYSPLDENNSFINMDELNDLVNSGYEIVLAANSESDVVELKNKYTNAGLQIMGFYFPNNDISEDQKNRIKNMGIDFVITPFNTFVDDALYSVASYGSNYENVKFLFETNVRESTIAAYTVGNNKKEDAYSYVNLSAMLDVMSEYDNDNMTKIVNLSDAKQRYIEYQDYVTKTFEKEELDRIAELEQRLKEIDEELSNK